MAALLVDEGIGQHLVDMLITQGLNAIHWLSIGRKGVHDSVVFFEAQRRGLTVFTHNRDDYLLLATAWQNWGLGDHQGIIAPRQHKTQLPPSQLYPIMAQFCADTSSFVNRIELF